MLPYPLLYLGSHKFRVIGVGKHRSGVTARVRHRIDAMGGVEQCAIAHERGT